MLNGNGTSIHMAEGDFGEEMPFVITGEDIEKDDIFVFKIKNKEKEIIKKNYTLNERVFLLSFTEEESKLLPAGNYRWGLKQYREGKLINTIVLSEQFRVERGV